MFQNQQPHVQKNAVRAVAPRPKVTHAAIGRKVPAADRNVDDGKCIPRRERNDGGFKAKSSGSAGNLLNELKRIDPQATLAVGYVRPALKPDGKVRELAPNSTSPRVITSSFISCSDNEGTRTLPCTEQERWNALGIKLTIGIDGDGMGAICPNRRRKAASKGIRFAPVSRVCDD